MQKNRENIHAEHLKYVTPERSLKYVLFLIELVWMLLQVPTRWLTTSNTCLRTRRLRSLGKKAREVSKIATLSKVVSAWNYCSWLCGPEGGTRLDYTVLRPTLQVRDTLRLTVSKKRN